MLRGLCQKDFSYITLHVMYDTKNSGSSQSLDTATACKSNNRPFCTIWSQTNVLLAKWINSNISKIFCVSFIWCQSEDNSNIGGDKKKGQGLLMPLLSSTTFGKLWYCVLLCALNVKIAFQDKEKEYLADVTSTRFLLLQIIPSLLYHFLEKRPKEISCTCAVCFLFLNPRSSKLCCFQNFLWKSRAQTKTTKQACWLCIRRKKYYRELFIHFES